MTQQRAVEWLRRLPPPVAGGVLATAAVVATVVVSLATTGQVDWADRIAQLLTYGVVYSGILVWARGRTGDLPGGADATRPLRRTLWATWGPLAVVLPVTVLLTVVSGPRPALWWGVTLLAVVAAAHLALVSRRSRQTEQRLDARVVE